MTTRDDEAPASEATAADRREQQQDRQQQDRRQQQRDRRSSEDDPETAQPLPAASLAARAAERAVGGSRRAADGEIWTLAWPVIFSQALASVVSLIDIAMVGRLSRESVAAVGYTTQYFNLAQSILFAVGAACVALMARAIGAGDRDRARAAFAGSLLVTGAIATVFTAVMITFPHFWLDILDAEPAVADVGTSYFRLTLGSTLLLAASTIIESGFRAIRNTRTAMGIAVAVTIAKTGLNSLLMFGAFGLPRLELMGAGLATLLTQVIAFGLYMAAARRGSDENVLRLSAADFKRAWPMLGTITRIALPAIGERVVLNVAILTYFTVLSQYGTVQIAAYTIGVRLLSFSWIPGTGFSVAAATLVGQALGAENRAAAARAGWRAARLALIVSIVLGLAFGLAREPIARAFTSDASVVEALGPFMLLLALAQPPMGVHFTLGGALRGAGDTWTPLIAATLGNWGFRVPLALLGPGFHLDVMWVWAALIADHFARAVWLTIAFRRGRWQRKIDK